MRCGWPHRCRVLMRVNVPRADTGGEILAGARSLSPKDRGSRKPWQRSAGRGAQRHARLALVESDCGRHRRGMLRQTITRENFRQNVAHPAKAGRGRAVVMSKARQQRVEGRGHPKDLLRWASNHFPVATSDSTDMCTNVNYCTKGASAGFATRGNGQVPAGGRVSSRCLGRLGGMAKGNDTPSLREQGEVRSADANLAAYCECSLGVTCG